MVCDSDSDNSSSGRSLAFRVRTIHYAYCIHATLEADNWHWKEDNGERERNHVLHRKIAGRLHLPVAVLNSA